MNAFDLPKAELHCHLDGSLRPETLLALGKKRHLAWAEVPLAVLEKTIRAGQPKESLEDYLQIFAYTLAVLQDAAAIEQVAYELGIDAAAENVRHLEVRFGPLLNTREGLAPEAVVEAALCGLQRAAQETSLSHGLILCGLRDAAPEMTVQVAELAKRFARDGVVAVDLAGPERGYPARLHQKAFDIAREAGLGITIHAGEAEGAWAVKEAIVQQHATRIGHGTHAIEDPALVDLLAEKKIALEVCLTSNLETKSIENIAAHPLRQLRAKGVRVTLNTDNRLISKVRLTDEFDRAAKAFALSDDEIRDIALAGFEAAFVSPEQRQRLLSDFD